ncbi:MAG: choice-of-anchor Q domain-containing protein [Solirubrobacterales bacterium]
MKGSRGGGTRIAFGVLVAAAVSALPAPNAVAVAISPDALTDGIATNNNCTLREAVQAANKNIPIDDCPAGSASEEDHVFLDSGHYKLTASGDDEAANLTGDLDLDENGGPLSIRGAGRTATFIDSEMDDRVLETSENLGGEFTLADLTVAGNQQSLLSGGAIMVGSDLTADRIIVESGKAQFGGGISCRYAELKLRNSIVRDNQSVVSSTGFPNVIAAGGGILVTTGCTATITDSLVEDNESIANDSQALGGGIVARGTKLKLRRSTVTGNSVFSSTNSPAVTSVRQGGGIYVEGQPTVIISNATIADNTASSVGRASTGGGVFLGVGDANVRIDATTLSHNSATSGTSVAALGGNATIGGSILANTATGTVCSQASGGKVKTRGYNVINPAPSGCMHGAAAAKDVIDVPDIGSIPIANGGPTPTLAIPGSSPAANLVPTKECRPAKRSDQRGAERPAGGRCDAGAYDRTKCRGVLADSTFTFLTAGDDNTSGLSGDDFLAPSAGDDKYRSFEGNDVLCGGSGDDRLVADEGKDKLDGGRGKDVCDGGAGNDSAVACEKQTST